MKLYAHLLTSKGEILMELLRDIAPSTVAHFVQLATGSPAWTDPRTGLPTTEPYYRDLPIIAASDGIVQTGCWKGDGTGFVPPPQPYEEPPTRSHVRGAVSMARAGRSRYGGQFFICLTPQPHLDPFFTVFAMVKEGWDVLQELTTDDVLERTWIEEY